MSTALLERDAEHSQLVAAVAFARAGAAAAAADLTSKERKAVEQAMTRDLNTMVEGIADKNQCVADFNKKQNDEVQLPGDRSSAAPAAGRRARPASDERRDERHLPGADVRVRRSERAVLLRGDVLLRLRVLHLQRLPLLRDGLGPRP